MMFAGNDKKPVGGHILAHACHPETPPLHPSPHVPSLPISLPRLDFATIVLDGSSATRIYLRKGRAEERVAKLQDSPDRPEKEASYQITEGGITDIG
jgi:hypothetical protein